MTASPEASASRRSRPSSSDCPTSGCAKLDDLQPYEPGPRMPELERRYGRALVRLNRNEDLFPPFPGMREAVEAELPSVWMYPEESYDEFRAAVARRIGTTPDRIVPA